MRISDWSSDVCSSDLWSPSLLLSVRTALRNCKKMEIGCTRPRPLDHWANGPVRVVIACFRSLGRCSSSRSEEHTSELQSLMRISYAVFCLKKKKKQMNTKNTHAQPKL